MSNPWDSRASSPDGVRHGRLFDAPMHQHDEDDDSTLDEDVLPDDVAVVACPYCGEPNEIGLDPGSGATQTYVEDCQVCCQPWNVSVTYAEDGSADVHVTAADE